MAIDGHEIISIGLCWIKCRHSLTEIFFENIYIPFLRAWVLRREIICAIHYYPYWCLVICYWSFMQWRISKDRNLILLCRACGISWYPNNTGIISIMHNGETARSLSFVLSKKRAVNYIADSPFICTNSNTFPSKSKFLWATIHH